MRVTIYLKDGAYIDDCLIDTINLDPESNMIEFTDRFGNKQVRKFSTIACIMIKGVFTYENTTH